MAITWIKPIVVTPDSTGWQDVDVSAYVPGSTTGVILHIVNTTYDSSIIGWRKNGSTDNIRNFIYDHSHLWVAIGVDGSQIFEFDTSVNASAIVYLVGYFESDTTFFTNSISKSLDSTGSWIDIDISGDTGGNTAIGAIFQIKNSAPFESYGLRKNGSTDNRVDVNYRLSCAVIGVDGSEICEGQINNTNVDFYLNGYITTSSTFNTNATDLSLGSTGSWTDLTALPAGANGGFIELNNSSGNYGLRRNGTGEEIYETTDLGDKVFGLVACDSSKLIEGKISSTSTDFFLVGYSSGSVDVWAVEYSSDNLINASIQVKQTHTNENSINARIKIPNNSSEKSLISRIGINFESEKLLVARIKKKLSSDKSFNARISGLTVDNKVMTARIKKKIESEKLLNSRIKVENSSAKLSIARIQKTFSSNKLLISRISKSSSSEKSINAKITVQRTSEKVFKATVQGTNSSENVFTAFITGIYESSKLMTARVFFDPKIMRIEDTTSQTTRTTDETTKQGVGRIGGDRIFPI